MHKFQASRKRNASRIRRLHSAEMGHRAPRMRSLQKRPSLLGNATVKRMEERRGTDSILTDYEVSCGGASKSIQESFERSLFKISSREPLMNYILIFIYIGFVSGALYILRDAMDKNRGDR